jgi:arginyl-tRNA synthetase
MPPCLLLKADGATLYATRDIAAAQYRKDTYDFYKCLYVVAYQQNLHFQQVFKVIELMGRPWHKDLEHVAFGMVSLEEGAMSTRKGNLIRLEDVLDKCAEKALSVIREKNPALENAPEIAEIVGTGAVVFSALYRGRIKDIVFSYDSVLNFDGETGPYLQYTCVRANSVLAKAGGKNGTGNTGGAENNGACGAENGGEYKPYAREYGAAGFGGLADAEFELVKLLAGFKRVLRDAAERNEPSHLTRFLVDTAAAFNKFYIECRILSEEEPIRARRLAVTDAARRVLTAGLEILGIGIPPRM